MDESSKNMRHISIRVPWHDMAWDGRVCAESSLNGACLKLKRIAAERDDEAEERMAGQWLEVLNQEDWPCCVAFIGRSRRRRREVTA